MSLIRISRSSSSGLSIQTDNESVILELPVSLEGWEFDLYLTPSEARELATYLTQAWRRSSVDLWDDVPTQEIVVQV